MTGTEGMSMFQTLLSMVDILIVGGVIVLLGMFLVAKGRSSTPVKK